jgi:hypothetical protein
MEPAKRRSSPAVSILAGLTLLSLSICGISPLIGELKSGRAYTLGVMFADATKVSRIDSPLAFWANLGWQVLGCGIGVVLGIASFCQVIYEFKKRRRPSA